MKALSFSQPWLWSILHAGKRVENRSWQAPHRLLPLRIALHAAKSWDDDALNFFDDIGVTGYPTGRANYVKGAIVGVATVIECVDADIGRHLPDVDGQRRWFFGPFGWLLDNVVELKTPIPASGALGLWNVTADVIAEIARQTGEELR